MTIFDTLENEIRSLREAINTNNFDDAQESVQEVHSLVATIDKLVQDVRSGKKAAEQLGVWVVQT